MEEHKVRRLPVIDNHRLVGIVSEADIARHLPEHAIADFAKAICSPLPITRHWHASFGDLKCATPFR